MLEGSVQRSGNRLRVNAQLVDAETGNHLWAERFDKSITDLFDLQDEIVSRLANTLNTQLIEVEARRAERSPHPNSMDLYFQGRACLNKGITPEHLEQALGFFERALALDPDNIEALIGTAEADVAIGSNFFTDDRASRLAAAEVALIKALSMDPLHARAHMFLGAAQISAQMYTARATQGINECEQALALDQNLAAAHAVIGWGKYLLGRGAETEAHINEALRLSPRDIFAYRWLHILGLAKLHLGADAEAVTCLRRGIEANRNHPLAHFHLAAALALVGALDEARSAMREGLALSPSFTIRRLLSIAPSDNPTYRVGGTRILEGMRMAGVPEG